jgi:double-stranded uracil-DNA glycosylase
MARARAQPPLFEFLSSHGRDAAARASCTVRVSPVQDVHAAHENRTVCGIAGRNFYRDSPDREPRATLSRMLLRSFPPVVGRDARVLVLGSMPGEASLAAQRYYAHPRNLFWPIMGVLVDAAPELAYEARLRKLKDAGIALWDVLAACQREGSLDQRIVRETEQPNAIAALLRDTPTLRTLAFNGAKAAQSYARHVAPQLDDAVRESLRLMPLPSTSPANAGQPYAVRLARWREILAVLAPRRRS